jgi:GMP synthase-like glutamine amidotransferase
MIETGRARKALIDRFGDYPAMVASRLRPYLEGAAFSAVSPVSGEGLPEVEAFDAYVIMGSRHAVYDDLPWLDPLKRFIAKAAGLGIPLAGICFGHQIMAEALGGRVEKAEVGWMTGATDYSVCGTNATIRSMVFHQDQVVAQPPDSEVVLSNVACPIAGLLYTRIPAVSVQAHPEFDEPFMRELLRYTRGNPVDSAIVDEALDRMGGPLDQERFFRVLALVLAKTGETRSVTALLAGRR